MRIKSIHPDVIVSWPRNCDYPPWRQFIRLERDRFDKVIVVFTQTHQGYDYSEFVKDAMADDFVTFLDNDDVKEGDDWRNIAVNKGLTKSNSKWIWFTEQDFYIYDPTFWQDIYMKALKGYELMAIKQGERLHPACIFIERKLLDKTRKNFGIIRNKSDHFSMLQEDVEKLEPQTVIYADEEFWGYKHFNGLSHNWTLANNGMKPNYKPEEFYTWIDISLGLKNLEMSDEFVEVAKRIISAKNIND
jgi:hypothetical protein